MVTCIHKYYKNNIIIGYVLQNPDGSIFELTSEQLKYEMQYNHLAVSNLTLTKDNRILSKVKYPKSDVSSVYNRNTEILLCHGSSHVLQQPIYGLGEESNDYGRGFYTVFDKEKELAKEWACSPFNRTDQGFINTYLFNTQGINVLNLNKMAIIYWIVLTATYRKPNISVSNLMLLQSKYFVDVNLFDCILGWCCDDTYSNIVVKFMNNVCTDKAVESAIRLGHLKQQFVLISEKAFKQIKFVTSEGINDFSKYRNKFNTRKLKADTELSECIKRNRLNGMYLDDYLEGIRNNG